MMKCQRISKQSKTFRSIQIYPTIKLPSSEEPKVNTTTTIWSFTRPSMRKSKTNIFNKSCSLVWWKIWRKGLMEKMHCFPRIGGSININHFLILQPSNVRRKSQFGGPLQARDREDWNIFGSFQRFWPPLGQPGGEWGGWIFPNWPPRHETGRA